MSAEREAVIDDVRLHLVPPVARVPEWIGQQEVLLQLLAAWTCISEHDLPLNPRLLGKPGVGKTTLAGAAARHLGLEIYIVQATIGHDTWYRIRIGYFDRSEATRELMERLRSDQFDPILIKF